MFSEFFKLKVNPFGETPDTKFFFKASAHVAALDQLMNAIEAGKGFTLVTGEVGVGKTILSRLLLNFLVKRTPTALILNPVLEPKDLLTAIREELKLPAPTENTFKAEHDELTKFFIQTAAAGKKSVLIIDEAQRLSFEGLECIRLLSNLETESRKLLQIILIGQSELNTRLETFELRQLNQRIAVRAELKPLSREETEFYIKHRIEVAGGANFVRFEADAVSAVLKLSGGVPRLVNAICERTLQEAEKKSQRLIDAKLVKATWQPAAKPSWKTIFNFNRGANP